MTLKHWVLFLNAAKAKAVYCRDSYISTTSIAEPFSLRNSLSFKWSDSVIHLKIIVAAWGAESNTEPGGRDYLDLRDY